MQNMNIKLKAVIKFWYFLSLIFVVACNPDSADTTTNKSAPKLSIDNFNCQSDPITNHCRDIGLLFIEYQATDADGDLESVSGKIESAELGLSLDMLLVDEKMQVALSSFSGASDVLVTLIAKDKSSRTTTATENIGAISVNTAPICTSPVLIQNFSFNENNGSVELIDIASCSDPESDQITLSNQVLNTTISGDYSYSVTVRDEFGLSTNYLFTGNIARRNLTVSEFTEQLIADPGAVGANSCFNPINQVYDETVVCNFSNEWHGFQYGSNQDTSLFANIALIDSAQGFTNFPVGPSLNEIVANFIASDLPDNQAVTNPGNSTIAIIGTIDLDGNGLFINSVITGGFSMQGAATENSIISCENQAYTLPTVSITGTRSSLHSIDQSFVINLAQSQRISNCVSTNSNGIQTVLEGDIDIVVSNTNNQNPTVNTVNGLTQGIEGLRTVVANVTDFDANLSSVRLRYRVAGSGSAWTESSMSQQGTTDNFVTSLSFDYASNLDESGTIEYYVVAMDSFGGQGASTLINATFFANENTAQTILENEITIDANKSVNCFDCTFIDPVTSNTIGPFDGLFTDPSQANHSYEYNGEGRSAAAMTDLANSVVGTPYDFHEIPIGTISDIRIDIQNN